MNAAAPIRAAAPPLLLLVLLAGQQPLALNFIAPATPGLARSLATDYGTIQFTLTLYLVAVAAAQLVGGPLSDRHGRRPLVIGSMALYAFGCALAWLADSATTLIAARILQGAGAGSVFALVRAVIRDTAGREETASRIGYVTTVMVVVPMVSPMLGGVIDQQAGWRAIFGIMTICGLAALAVSIASLPETNLARDATASIRKLLAGFATLWRLPAFLAPVLVLASTSGAFFAFVGASPYIVVETMGRGPEAYGLWFVFVSVGYMAGNFCSGRFASKFGIERFMAVGTTVTAAAMVVTWAAILAFGWHPAALFLPMLIFSFGNGLTMPCATAATLSVRPDLAGAAAGLSGAIQLGLGALASMVASMGVVHSPWALLVVMAATALVGMAAALAARRLG